MGNGGEDAEILQQRSSQAAQSRIEKRLAKGQRALRAVRCRVSGGMLALGIGGSIVYQVQYAMVDSIWVDAAGWTIQAISFLVLNLAPLPDDKRLTQVVLMLTAALMAAAALIDIEISPHDKSSWRMFCLSPDGPDGWSCRAVSIYGNLARIMDVFFLVVTVGALSLLPPERAQACTWVSLTSIFSCCLVWDIVFTIGLWVLQRRIRSNSYYLLGDLLGICVAARPRVRFAIQQRLRQLFQRRQATAAAAGLASLVGNCPTGQVLEEARARFRCISLADIDEKDIADNSPDSGLFKRSQHARLRRCDAFISHSWHDDSAVKWDALQAWRADFVREHGREPAVWFDKCCIDQNNIELDLRCLPIFLAGCKRLVIFCGPTYLGRLWCILEIFTFVHMGGDLADIELRPLVRSGCQADEMTIRAAFARFDARRCDCFNPEDKDKMLTIIRTAFGRLESFNQAVSAIMVEAGWRDACCTSDDESSSDSSPSEGESDDCTGNPDDSD